MHRPRYSEAEYQEELQQIIDLGKQSHRQTADWDKQGYYEWSISAMDPPTEEWNEAYDQAYKYFKETLPERFPAVAASTEVALMWFPNGKAVIESVAIAMAGHVATQLVIERFPDNGFIKPS